MVAELKLRNINEEYILNRTKDIAKLEGEIAELEETLSSEENIKKVISDELAAVNKKYVMPRRTGRIEPHEVIEVSLEPEVEEYPVTIMLSRDGYLKKMTDRVLKKATTLKYKDGDKPFIEFPSSNTHELLVFTNKSQVYKCKVAAFEDTKSAQLGSYLPTDLEMEPDESVIWVIDPRTTRPTCCSSLRTAAWCASRFPDTSPRPTASASRTPSTVAASCCMPRCSRRTATSRWSRATIV